MSNVKERWPVWSSVWKRSTRTVAHLTGALIPVLIEIAARLAVLGGE